MPSGPKYRALTAAAVCVLSLLAAGSLLAGLPRPLPQVALGAPWLLHVERVVLGALGLAVLVTLVVRMSRGQLPLKLSASALEFEPSGSDRGAGDEILEADLEVLKRRLDGGAPH